MSTLHNNMLSYNKMALVLITHLVPTHHSILSYLLKQYKKIDMFYADELMNSSVKPFLGENIIDGGESWKATGLNPEN